MAPTPPEMEGSGSPKIVQISDLKKRALCLQNGLPLGPQWAPKFSKIGQKCLPRAAFGPLPKIVSKIVAFLTLQTLENQAPACTGASFSLCAPAPKMSPKCSSKTSLKGHLKIQSKIHSEKCPKIT